MGEESNSASSETHNKMEDRTSLDLRGHFAIVPEKEKTITSQSWYKMNNEIAVNLPLGVYACGGHVFCYGELLKVLPTIFQMLALVVL